MPSMRRSNQVRTAAPPTAATMINRPKLMAPSSVMSTPGSSITADQLRCAPLPVLRTAQAGPGQGFQVAAAAVAAAETGTTGGHGIVDAHLQPRQLVAHFHPVAFADPK